eukprot:g6035.t1
MDGDLIGREENSVSLTATLSATEINYDDALWHACRLGEIELCKWALGLEEGEGLLIYDESAWQVKKGNGYVPRRYDRGYAPAFRQKCSHIAAINGHKDVLELLFQSGWRTQEPDVNGQTPGDLASLSGHDHIAEWIRGLSGAPSKLHFELLQEVMDHDKIVAMCQLQPKSTKVMDAHQRTALHLATKKKAGINIVSIIYKHNEKAMLCYDSTKRRPLDYAFEAMALTDATSNGVSSTELPQEEVGKDNKVSKNHEVFCFLLSKYFDVSLLSNHLVSLKIVKCAIGISKTDSENRSTPNIFNTRNEYGYPPLHQATRIANATGDANFAIYMLELTKLLYAETSDVTSDIHGQTKQMAAMSSPIPEIKEWAKGLGLLFQRYKLVSGNGDNNPFYRSVNCEMYLAVDLKAGSKIRTGARMNAEQDSMVIMKFLRKANDAARDTHARKMLKGYDDVYVNAVDGGIIQETYCTKNAETHIPSWTESDSVEVINCVVSKKASRSLQNVIDMEGFFVTECIDSTFFHTRIMPILKRILDILQMLHEHKNLVYSDLSPKNVLKVMEQPTALAEDDNVSMNQTSLENYKWKITSISYMSKIGSPTQICWGTRDLCYCPPEYIREVLSFRDMSRDEYGTSELIADAKFDVWSFGCILYYLTAGRPLFTVTYPVQGYLKNISNWPMITNEHLSYVMIDDPFIRSHVVDLLKLCLKGDQKDRIPSVARILQHRLFNNAKAIAFKNTLHSPRPVDQRQFEAGGNYGIIISIGDYNRGTHGVSTTNGGMPQLRCSHEDANMMRMIFLVSTDPTRLAFTSNYLTFILFSSPTQAQGCQIVSYLVDDNATVKTVMDAFLKLKELTSGSKHGRLFVYIKCRTYLPDERNEYYLACIGAVRQNYYATMINLNFLKKMASELDVSHQLWICDFVGGHTLFESEANLPSHYFLENEQDHMAPSIMALTSVMPGEKMHFNANISVFVDGIASAIFEAEKEEFMGVSHVKAQIFKGRKQYAFANDLHDYLVTFMKSKLSAGGQKQTVDMKPLVKHFKSHQCNGNFVFFLPDIGRAHRNIDKPRSRHDRLVEKNRTPTGESFEEASDKLFEL